MFPISVQDQLPQNKLSGMLVAFAQGVWGEMEDGTEGFVFPTKGNTFTWAHDQNWLQDVHGVSEEALMDCLQQIEDQLGNPEQVRHRFGLMKGGGQHYIGLTATSTVDDRIVCSYTPTSHYSSDVEGYFEWYLKDQSQTTLGLTVDDAVANVERMAGVDPNAGGILKPTLPSYEEAAEKLITLGINEGRRESFLQRLWDYRKHLAPGFKESAQKDLMKEWKVLTKRRGF